MTTCTSERVEYPNFGQVDVIKYVDISIEDSQKARKFYNWMEYVADASRRTLMLVVPVKN